jgi:hypothetical protein
MEKRVPQLFTDSSIASKKATLRLTKANKQFEVWKVTTISEKASLKPPVLFAPEGVFRGYKAIDAYAGSTFGQKIK